MRPPARWPAAAQWAALVALSAAFAAALLALRLPAALLLGPMLAGIAFGCAGVALRAPRRGYLAAQALIGCLVARAITPAIAAAFALHGTLLVGVVLATLLASTALGALLARLGALPGTAAIWGVTPGAATAMVLMAEAYGADARLVAFMQYLRVVAVALAATLVAHVWMHAGAAPPPPPKPLFAPFAPWPLASTVLVAALGGWLGTKLRIPAGTLLVPAAAAIVLHLGGWLRIELPGWLLAPAYAMIGWSIGLGFTRGSVRYAARRLPAILLSIALLVGACGALAYLLVRCAGVDALTAYLATSPGGMDSVAIIAASSHVDLPFVMAMQAVRLVLVIALGPRLARWSAARAARRTAPEPERT